MDLRPLLFNNVIVTGGNTLFTGFTERLSNELPMMIPGVKFLSILIYLLQLTFFFSTGKSKSSRCRQSNRT
jgi:actin-related protein